MHIARLQVEEGFLDGLDLRFARGLNVLIGARGTGKTSIIELLRFALGVDNIVRSASVASHEHVSAILGTGRVIVTLGNGAEEIVVVRSLTDSSAQAVSDKEKPMILSQTEIENLGVLPDGRLRLLDGFVANENRTLEDRELVAIRSYSKDISVHQRELEELEADISRLPALHQELNRLMGQEAGMVAASAEAAAKNAALQKETVLIGRLAVAHDDISRLNQRNAKRTESLDGLINQWGEDDQSLKSSETLSELFQLSADALESILHAKIQLEKVVAKTESIRQKIEINRVAVEQRTRSYRQEIEKLSEGSGKISAQGVELRKQIARVTSLLPLANKRTVLIDDLRKKRSNALDTLEHLRDMYFQRRADAASYLTERLQPRIRVKVERSGQSEHYAAVIANALRGSGVRYNELSRELAVSVSPRELAEWAETMNVELLSSAVSMPSERAYKCLSAIKQAGIEALLTFDVQDQADFYLWDQSVHKPISSLSMGQRCTVVLPIILERQGRVLILDQPEDHIDNAFIAETLIRGIVDRAETDQVIISTHNANIPVLGNAALVVQLGSDGKRGYVAVSAGLDDPRAVEAITGIMEGGRQAFAHRANFYARTN